VRRSALLIAGAACLAYLTAFAGAFQFDDYAVIVDAERVHSWSGWLGSLGGLRPVLSLAYTLNWTSGAGLFGFHLFNVALHAANAVMVYALFGRFSDEKNAALVAALLFALHPVQTEAVTYVSGRSASLMAAFYLGSVLAYARGRETRSALWLYVVSPALFVLAFLTKETAVTLPVALVLFEATRPVRERFLRLQVVHWAILGGLGVLLFAHPGYARSLGYALNLRSVHDNLLSQIDGVWYLLSRLAWPAELELDPALPVVSRWTWLLAAKALLLAALLAAGLASLRRRPWLAFGVLWFFLQLAPTQSVVPRRDIVNERHVYLAAAGLFFAGSVALSRVLSPWPRWRTAVAAALLTVLAARTTLRNLDYRSEVAMWESAVRASPDNARAYNNLGYAYALRGDDDAAREAYRAAIRLRPNYVRALNNLSALE
jgi:tetratricopeptide (TPR) repeat protein